MRLGSFLQLISILAAAHWQRHISAAAPAQRGQATQQCAKSADPRLAALPDEKTARLGTERTPAWRLRQGSSDTALAWRIMI